MGLVDSLRVVKDRPIALLLMETFSIQKLLELKIAFRLIEELYKTQVSMVQQILNKFSNK